jgi:hypothetical protein
MSNPLYRYIFNITISALVLTLPCLYTLLLWQSNALGGVNKNNYVIAVLAILPRSASEKEICQKSGIKYMKCKSLNISDL